MLEHPALLLLPWEFGRGETPAPARARILDPATDQEAGFANRGERPGRAWWDRPLLTVHENDDAPLVFTIRRGIVFGRRWRVEDAEGRFVGRVVGRRLRDRSDRPLAVLLASADRSVSVYHGGPAGELATLRREEKGVRLTFAASARDNPFAKMVLLAAALVHGETSLVR